MVAQDLSIELTRERQLLELLLHSLDVQRMLVVDGNSQGHRYVVTDIERVMGELPSTAVSRDCLAAAVADEWAAAESATLLDLIHAAPTDAWRAILTGHRDDLVALADEIDRVRRINQDGLDKALHSTREEIKDLEVVCMESLELEPLEKLVTLQAAEGVLRASLDVIGHAPQENLLSFLR